MTNFMIACPIAVLALIGACIWNVLRPDPRDRDRGPR